MTGEQDKLEGLRGRHLAKALVLLAVFGVAHVGWKFVKHNWLADHGYLSEDMRDYWIAFGVAWVAILLWAAKTRFRL